MCFRGVESEADDVDSDRRTFAHREYAAVGHMAPRAVGANQKSRDRVRWRSKIALVCPDLQEFPPLTIREESELSWWAERSAQRVQCGTAPPCFRIPITSGKTRAMALAVHVRYGACTDRVLLTD